MPAENEQINVWLRLRGARQYIKEMALVDTATKRVNTGMAALGRETRKKAKEAGSFRQSMTIMRKSVVGLAGASTAFALIGLAGTVLDFEEAMARTKATLTGTEGFNDKMFDSLQDKAMQVATASRFSSTEVAQGTFELASAGLKAQEVLDALTGTTNLAGAAAIEMADAAKIQAMTLNQFGLDATQAGRVADVLTKAVNEGAAQLPELANSLSYVGPVAKAFGTDLEDVITALTLLGNKGIEGSKAGTSLRQFFVRVTRPTKMVKSAFKDLNMSADDLVNPKTGNLYALPVLLDKLKKGLGSVDPTTARRALSQITGSEALTSVLQLINASGKEWDVMSGSIENSAGSAQKFSDIMMNTVRGRLDEFINTLQNYGIILLRKFSPAIKGGLSAATDFFASLQDKSSTARKVLDPFFRTVVAVFSIIGSVIKILIPAVIVIGGAFFAAFVPIAPILETIAEYLKPLIPFLGALAAGFAALFVARKALLLLKGAIWLVGFAWGKLSLLFSMTPLGRIIVLGVTLFVLLRMLYQRSERFRNIVDAVWGVLKDTFGWIQNNWRKIGATFLTTFTPFGIAIGIAMRAWKVLRQAFDDFIAFMRGDWSKIDDLLAAPFKLAWAIIEPIVGPMIDLIEKAADFLGGFGGLRSGAGAAGVAAQQEAYENIRRSINTPGAAAGGYVTAGGSLLVGERGPELVNLGAGARVVPLRPAIAEAPSSLPSDGGTPDLVVLRVDLDGRTIAETTHSFNERRRARR